MPLATKNGAIIVKDGKLAESCGCCGGGLCVCDAAGVTVSVSSGNFLRHLLLRDSFGQRFKVSLGYIAAPSSGVHVLRKVTVDGGAGISPSKWVSDYVPSPGSGRITAVVYRAAGNTPVRVTVGIPVWYWRYAVSEASLGGDFEFKSLEEMIAQSTAGNVFGQGFGTLVVELECDSQTGTSRVLSLSPVHLNAWSPNGSTAPLLACDFVDANAVQGGSVWWEGQSLRKGQERSLSPHLGLSIVSDTRTGDNIVTLDGVDLKCCEDEAGGVCCPFDAASGVEVTVSGVNHVARYIQPMTRRFITDAACCLMPWSDRLFTSYVFAGQYATGTFSLTKAVADVTLPFSQGKLPAGTWYYISAGDDVVFWIAITTNEGCAATLYFSASSWSAYHWEVNENEWCNQPGFNCRSPSSIAGRHYGLGEKNTVAGNAVYLSCFNVFMQSCSSGFGGGCDHPTNGTNAVARAADRVNAVSKAWALTDFPKTGNAYNVNLVAKYEPILISRSLCADSIAPVLDGGDSSPIGGSDVITISKVVLM